MSDHDPREDYDDEPGRRRTNVAAMVHWPALILGTFGVLQLAFSLVGCVWLPCALVWNWIDPEFFDNEGPAWEEVLLGTLACAVCAGLNWVIVIGARRLGAFKNYRLAVTAIILSFVPLPIFYCGVVTLPIGIWALVVVLNPDVRARFEATRAAKDGDRPAASEPPAAP